MVIINRCIIIFNVEFFNCYIYCIVYSRVKIDFIVYRVFVMLEVRDWVFIDVWFVLY